MVFPAASGCRWAAGERPGSLASADPETTKTWATAQVLRSVSGVQRTAPCRGPFARTEDRTGAGESQAVAPPLQGANLAPDFPHPIVRRGTSPAFMTELLPRIQAALAKRYAIQRELGHGGMAVVFYAEDRKHHRPVAVKVLRPELGAVIGSERFLREIRSEEHTSELQSQSNLVCRLLLEKKKMINIAEESSTT